MIAGDRHDPRTRPVQTHQRLIKQRHRIGRRNRPVVEIPRDDHEVDLGLRRQPHKPVNSRRLLRQQRLTVECPTQMPVRGMEQPHGRRVSSTCDTESLTLNSPRRQAGPRL